MKVKIFSTILTSTIIFIVTIISLNGLVISDEIKPKEILLWEGDIPEGKGIKDQDKPKISLFVPEKPNGAAVVICPGGAYSGLALEWEGVNSAKWFTSKGVTAAVLAYRHARRGGGHPKPLLDAQRAIRYLRTNAETLRIKSDQIGIAGFSAGGHLASTTGTHFEDHAYPSDEIDKASSRPDFMILIYPVISFDPKITHSGSRQNLIGNSPSEDLVKFYSSEKQVTEKTPRTFIIFTNEDQLVNPENGVEFYLALRKNKVPAEIHIFQKGKHGIGLGFKDQFNEWTNLCELWLQNNGILSPPPKETGK
ncbi:MAG: alpha/beta hydrolase [Planctomycetaceae bacterium]|jgi:acetyl esterase/lipase|nr:alpha/beta hydrolase [Planctomycetaceae bacterium]